MAKNKNSWGNAPQESVTAGSAGAWGSAPQESTTAGAAGKWGAAPQESTTAGSAQGWGSAPQESTTDSKSSGNRCPETPINPSYVLDGITFNVRKIVSEQSGEAIIFEVENEGKSYALKLYRSGVVPNHDVLQRIMEQRGSGLLIDIYAHGTWQDDTTGFQYHYELMEYCEGGSLAAVNLNGDEKKLREIATRMASALDFAHGKGVLHRDVKPANFLYVDKEHTRFVLSDWGLAKTLDKQGRAQTDAGRTKIYAAPEMYTYIPGTPTYVGPKADFFSMGMTLLALWMGEGKLLADETKLVHDKQEETLPYPRRGEMSDHSLGLIKALTRRNPEVRAGFESIVSWAKGEDIYTETDDSLVEFKIVFSATDNLIAHNPKELSDIMWSNQDLARKYLYTDKITKWFRDIERPELAMAMEDIIENRAPGDRDKGLYLACLTLNPEMPYWFETPSGRVKVNDLNEFGDAFASGTLGPKNVSALKGDDFLTWAATRDAVLAGKALKAKTGWNVLYSLLPDRGMDFLPIDESHLATPEHIAGEIVDEISGVKAENITPGLAGNFRLSRLYAYLQSKGIYDKQISWIEYCLELHSRDNAMKFVPYTLRVAALKSAAGLLGSVPPLTVGGHTFRKPADVEKIDSSSFDTDEQDIIADWLSLFYQEAPGADYKKKSYLQRTADYTYELDYLPDCTYSTQARVDGNDLSISMELNNSVWRKIKIWRWLTGIFCFLPLLIVCAAGIYMTITMGALDLSDSLGKVGHYIGIGVGIIVALCVLGSDYGFILAGIAGVLSYGLIKIALTFIGAIAPWIIIGLMLVAIIYLGKKVFFGEKRTFQDNYTSLDWDEVVDRYFIGVSYDCIDKVYPGDVPSDYPCCVIDDSSDVGLEELPVVRRSALMMLVMTIIGAALCWFTVKGLNTSNIAAAEGVELLSGQFTGDVSGTPLTVTFDLNNGSITADMDIRYSSGLTTQTMKSTEIENLPVTLYKEGNNEIYLRIDNVTGEGSSTVAKGVYCNSKKNIKTVNIQKK